MIPLKYIHASFEWHVLALTAQQCQFEGGYISWFASLTALWHMIIWHRIWHSSNDETFLVASLKASKSRNIMLLIFHVTLLFYVNWFNWNWWHIMTSSNANTFRVPDPLWGKSIGHRWIPFTKASDAELWCFLWIANSWANNLDAGDLRRHRAHYDITVMTWRLLIARWCEIVFVTDSCHFDHIGCTESCQNDNFPCTHWRIFRQNNISISLISLHLNEHNDTVGQSDPVITRFNITQRFIYPRNDKHKLGIRLRTHKRRHISRPEGRTLRRRLWVHVFLKKSWQLSRATK